jgi:hypothetical protein
LASYFRRKGDPAADDTWKGGYPRSLSELVHHQIGGQLWDGVERTLTTLPFLEANVIAGRSSDLANVFAAALEPLSEDRPHHRILRLLDEALRRDIHFIARHAQDYPQSLFQCLWNSCWWYDSPEAAQHYASPPPGMARADNGKRVAWFPVSLNPIATHPSGRTWAGDAANYLCLITLEGGDFPT